MHVCTHGCVCTHPHIHTYSRWVCTDTRLVGFTNNRVHVVWNCNSWKHSHFHTYHYNAIHYKSNKHVTGPIKEQHRNCTFFQLCSITRNLVTIYTNTFTTNVESVSCNLLKWDNTFRNNDTINQTINSCTSCSHGWLSQARSHVQCNLCNIDTMGPIKGLMIIQVSLCTKGLPWDTG